MKMVLVSQILMCVSPVGITGLPYRQAEHVIWARNRTFVWGKN